MCLNSPLSFVIVEGDNFDWEKRMIIFFEHYLNPIQQIVCLWLVHLGITLNPASMAVERQVGPHPELGLEYLHIDINLSI